MESIQIVLVDDHAQFRAGMRTLLRRVDDISIVGEAATGAEAIVCAAELQPDVVVMDIHMSDVDGIAATRQIVASSPHIRVLMLTMFEDDESVWAALRAGARGYILKGADKAELVRAIRAVAHGEAIFGPAIAQRLLQFWMARPAVTAAHLFPELTEREREILQLLARGSTNQAIAEHLIISPKTVRNHISNIFSKLHVADRTAAMLLARKAGLG